jgi:hypothetical protein
LGAEAPRHHNRLLTRVFAFFVDIAILTDNDRCGRL